jgi:beta-glucosidase
MTHKKPVGVRPLSLPNIKSGFPVLCWIASIRRSRIEVPRVDYEKLSSDRMGETSESIRKRVQAARNIQLARFANMESSNIVAIADVLFGKVNPCGKLAETFPLKLSDTPAYLNWPGGAGEVRYGEGLFIGYRFYDFEEMPVLFPFGYGLSYTTFSYSNAKVSTKTFKDVDGLTVTMDVTNTGKFAGKEIVQIYVHDHKSGLVRPEKELKGFAKVGLQPGETRSVSIPLDFRAFAYYHPEYKQWITEDGEFDILIAASAADIRKTLTVTLESTLCLPCILDKESTLREWLADPRGKAVFGPFYPQVEAQGRKMFVVAMNQATRMKAQWA